MKLWMMMMIATLAFLLAACGGGTVPSNPPVETSSAPQMAISPMPDDIGLIMQCNQCVFLEEQGQRFLAGQVHNDAKQAITGYVLFVDLQDAKGNSVRKIPGLMLMNAMALQPGETKEFRDQVISDEKNVTQATVYFKKSGRDVKLSEPLTLKLNAPPLTSAPGNTKSPELPKR